MERRSDGLARQGAGHILHPMKGCFYFILLQKKEKDRKINMKKTIKLITAVCLLIAMTMLAVACTKTDTDLLWESALHQTDKEFGSGAKTITVKVEAGERSVTFTLHTDKDTVGAALMEHGLIAGEDSQFGLYLKKANGITADYDIDGSYWAFYIDGETALTGVDGAAVEEGVAYSLVYTK